MRVLEVLAWQDLRLSENHAHILHFSNSLPLSIHVSGTKLLRIHQLAPETEPGLCSIINTIKEKADLN